MSTLTSPLPSPRETLMKVKAIKKRASYVPHTGQKQRDKLRRRILGQLLDIQAHGEQMRGFAGLQMLQKPEIGAFVKANPYLFRFALNMDAAIIIEQP